MSSKAGDGVLFSQDDIWSKKAAGIYGESSGGKGGNGGPGAGGGVQNNTWPLTVYGAYLGQSFYAYGSMGYFMNLFNQQRPIQIGTLQRFANSSPTGNQLNIYTEMGYDLKPKPFIVTPVVSLAYSSLWLNSYAKIF